MPHGLYLQGRHPGLLVEDQRLRCLLSARGSVGMDFWWHEFLSAMYTLFHFLHGYFYFLLDELLILLLFVLCFLVKYLLGEQAAEVMLVIEGVFYFWMTNLAFFLRLLKKLMLAEYAQLIFYVVLLVAALAYHRSRWLFDYLSGDLGQKCLTYFAFADVFWVFKCTSRA